MEPVFYEFYPKNSRRIGVLQFYGNEDLFPLSGNAVKDWDIPTINLEDGEYAHYFFGPGGNPVVSEELKELLEQYVEDFSIINFLPVNIVSNEYGDKIYYIVHFNRNMDVINEASTVYVSSTGSIIKVSLDYNKVKNQDIINTSRLKNDLIISSRIKKEMVKKKLNSGIEFLPIYCGNYEG